MELVVWWAVKRYLARVTAADTATATATATTHYHLHVPEDVSRVVQDMSLALSHLNECFPT